MRLLLAFARAHPRRTAVALACLLLAGVAEGVGLSSLMPLLSLAAEGGLGGGPASGGAAPAGAEGVSGLETTVREAFARVGLEPTLGVLVVLISGAMLAKAGLVLLANRQVGYAAAHVATDLRIALMRAVTGARWEYFIRQPAGGLANAFATEAERASQAYVRGALMTAAAIRTAIYAGFALAISWQATLGAVAIGAVTVLSLARLVRAARRAGLRQTRLLSSSLGRLTDALQAVKPLKAMAREARVGPLLEAEAQRLNRANRGEVLSKEALRSLQEPIVVVALLVGLYAAVSSWGLPLPTLTMLVFLFYRTLSSTNRVQKEYQVLAARESAWWSLRRTIDRAEAQVETSRGREAPELAHAIELRGVHFDYGSEPVLRDVWLRIPAGALTVLVGASGAGKTSIADLVIGLVRPTRGDVFIDGVPLAEVDLRRWRRRIGYVPQEVFLLHDSVAANVTLGDAGLGAEQVEAALEQAGAADFVAKLPEGVDTTVGERGARLSGGQRQRIAIARALVHRPQLLILDEATTALDPDTEAAICDTVARLRGEVTVLAITHERELVERADRVYRIEGGTAKET